MELEGSANEGKAPQDNNIADINKSVNKPGKNAVSSDEKALDSSYGDTSNKKPKGKKRKKRDETAPRQPLTGYVRYLNDRREQVRADNPGLSFPDLTKLMAGEWSQLPPEQKKLYLDAAELDRDRYSQEMSAYKQTEAYKIFIEQQTEKKPIGETKPENEAERDPFFSSLEIPIFTEEFLDHNKSRETELRQLRKSNIDMEQQASILKKHICDMRLAVEKMEAEAEQARANNMSLTTHLDQLRGSLVASLQAVPLPGLKEVPTMDSIDGVMTTVDQLLQDPASGKNPAFLGKVQLLSEHLKSHSHF